MGKQENFANTKYWRIQNFSQKKNLLHFDVLTSNNITNITNIINIDIDIELLHGK